MKAADRPRLHALDSLRAFLMLLGVVYHAVQFSITGHQLNGRAPLLEGFVFFVHTWRMPAFFLLSGFFTALLVARRGIPETARNRAARVLGPFLLALVTILPLDVFFISAYESLSHGEIRAAFTLDFVREAFAHRLRKPKLHHLWFLYYLSLYLSLYLGGRALTPAALARRLPAVAAPALAVLVLGALLAMPTPVNVDAPDGIFLRLPEFAFYFAFFLLGALTFRRYHREGALPEAGLLTSSVLALAGFGGLFASVGLPLTPELRALLALAKLASVLGSVYFLLALFRRFADREGKTARFLVRASFWTYLVHEPLLNALGTVFRSYTWAPALEIAVNAGLTYAACLLAYRYLVEDTALDRLLNGPARPSPARGP